MLVSNKAEKTASSTELPYLLSLELLLSDNMTGEILDLAYILIDSDVSVL